MQISPCPPPASRAVPAFANIFGPATVKETALFRWLRRSLSLVRRPPQAPPRARVQIEQLEDRCLPSVFTPAQVRHAYGFDRITFTVNGRSVLADGSGQTIAIVTAYDHPNIVSDLRYFSRTFRLPDPPSFTKAMPQGQPAVNSLWALETALDVQWAHAIAPKANILLVEARTNSGADLLGAVEYARQQPGVVVVSMSWGTPEFWGQWYYDGYFTTPAGHLGGSTGLPGARRLPGGITFVAASGDSGAAYGPSWPSVSANVLAVGGTSLQVYDQWGTYRNEVGWSGSGGGVSGYLGQPAYQLTVHSQGKRVTPDVAYNADPGTGFYVYTTVPYNGRTGWFSIGGTSAAAPQWAGLIALANQGRALQGKGSLDGLAQTLPALYSLAASAYHDITQGSNGYAATVGYDLVTGRGTPYAQRVVQALIAASSETMRTAGTVASTLPSGTFSMLVQPFLALGTPDILPDVAATPAFGTAPVPTRDLLPTAPSSELPLPPPTSGSTLPAARSGSRPIPALPIRGLPSADPIVSGTAVSITPAPVPPSPVAPLAPQPPPLRAVPYRLGTGTERQSSPGEPRRATDEPPLLPPTSDLELEVPPDPPAVPAIEPLEELWREAIDACFAEDQPSLAPSSPVLPTGALVLAVVLQANQVFTRPSERECQRKQADKEGEQRHIRRRLI